MDLGIYIKGLLGGRVILVVSGKYKYNAKERYDIISVKDLRIWFSLSLAFFKNGNCVIGHHEWC